MDGRFDELRAAIDRLDRDVVALVNERLGLVDELWQLKREQGVDTLDAGREQRLRAALHEANSGPLTAEGLDELITALLALIKRELARGSS
jgi:chorismate mutase